MHKIRMHPPLLLFSRGLSKSKPWNSLFGSLAASCYGGPWLCVHPPHDGVALLAALLRKMRLLILLSASRESHAKIISESQCLGAGLPLFTESPRRLILGNSGHKKSRGCRPRPPIRLGPLLATKWVLWNVRSAF